MKWFNDGALTGYSPGKNNLVVLHLLSLILPFSSPKCFVFGIQNQKPDSLDKNLRWQKNIEEKNLFTIKFYNLELVELNCYGSL